MSTAPESAPPQSPAPAKPPVKQENALLNILLNVLLPVTVVAPELTATPRPTSPAPRTASAGTIEIDIKGARVRVRGPVDEASIRAVLRTLACIA